MHLALVRPIRGDAGFSGQSGETPGSAANQAGLVSGFSEPQKEPNTHNLLLELWERHHVY